MHVEFYKYQGTGNDFVMIDNRSGAIPHESELVKKICDRKFGIGADGLILIQDYEGLDFEMVYFNADGSQSLCGNGSRCAVSFSQFLGIIGQETTFQTINGPLSAQIKKNIIHLKLNDQQAPVKNEDHYFLNNGSPHHIRFVENVAEAPVVRQGMTIRNSPKYKPGGTNVNFVEIKNQHEVFVRTYERGVEDETLSCGTGITASCLAAADKGLMSPIKVFAPGGELTVKFKNTKNGTFTDIWLIGPAVQVFKGAIDI